VSFIRPLSDKAFVRHYAEMVVAMYAGMLVLGFPLGRLESVPALELLGMAVVMTVPMVAWMRRRHGHGWRPCLEMAASMFIPTFAAIGLLAVHVASFGTLMAAEHLAMFPAMAIAMLIRPEEYGAPRSGDCPDPRRGGIAMRTAKESVHV
jgi:hypothetical protein